MNDLLKSNSGFLKGKLGNYQVNPPKQVWDSISARLSGRNRRGWIIITLSTAATIALAVTLGINLFKSDLPEETVVGEAEIGKLEEKVVQAMEEIAGKEAQVNEAITSGSVPEGVGEGLHNMKETVIESRAFQSDGDNEFRPTSVEELDKVRHEISNEESVYHATAEVETKIEQDPAVTLDPGAEYEEPQVRDKRWILGASLSPLYSFRDAESTALNGTVDYESGLVSYSGGIQVGYMAGKRLAIESGIFFSKMGVSIGAPGIQLFEQSFDFSPLGENANHSNVKAISNSVGNIVSNSGDIYVNNYKMNAVSEAKNLDYLELSEVNADQGIRQHLDYLEVPFNLRYTVIDRSVEFQIMGGISTNLLVNSYVSLGTAGGNRDIGYLTNIRNVNYSGNAGLGMVYHIREHFSLMIEPRFKYFLNSVNDESLPSTRPYAFGIYTGLGYSF